MVDMPSLDRYDHMERRCPRLGGPVPFRYCRNEAVHGDTCAKVFDCWWERFDVVDFLKGHLSAEAFAALHSPTPPDKVTSIVDLVRQARQRVDQQR